MTKWLSPVEKCDICRKPFESGDTFIDGKTHQGPWGILCSPCHETHGIGLGTGKGQRYDFDTREKIEG